MFKLQKNKFNLSNLIKSKISKKEKKKKYKYKDKIKKYIVVS